MLVGTRIYEFKRSCDKFYIGKQIEIVKIGTKSTTQI